MAKRDADDETNSPEKKQKITGGSSELDSLEGAYRTALEAFKKNKNDKDLRRAKSAAKKAWDAAVLAAANGNGEPITCKDCSQMFLFAAPKQAPIDAIRPTRCEKCNEVFRNRLKDRTKRDSTKRNMCYDFQKGECTRGNRCRFSHNPDHGGSANKVPVIPICHAFRKGNCEYGDRCRYRHEASNPAQAKLTDT